MKIKIRSFLSLVLSWLDWVVALTTFQKENTVSLNTPSRMKDSLRRISRCQSSRPLPLAGG